MPDLLHCKLREKEQFVTTVLIEMLNPFKREFNFQSENGGEISVFRNACTLSFSVEEKNEERESEYENDTNW